MGVLVSEEFHEELTMFGQQKFVSFDLGLVIQNNGDISQFSITKKVRQGFNFTFAREQIHVRLSLCKSGANIVISRISLALFFLI